MKTYTARAKKWDGGWELHIAGVGVTQSRTLRDAERMVRSYVAFDTGEERNSFAVEILPDLEGLEERVEEVRRATALATQAQRDAADLARSVVRELRTHGLSGNDIAAVLKVSPQRVSQIMRAGAAGAGGRVLAGKGRKPGQRAARAVRESARKS